MRAMRFSKERAVSIWAPPHVLAHYPEAKKSSAYISAFLWFARTVLKVEENRIALLLSICSDDLNNVQLPETDMVGPFSLGGLDGYPFVGRTGLSAFEHHIPEDGAALLFYGPHIGITNRGDVGFVVRPGQTEMTACCGAASAALSALEQGEIRELPIEKFDLDDFQQEAIRQWVLKHQVEILNAGAKGDSARIRKLTEVMYTLSHEAMLRHVSRVEFHCPALVFGGILINEDGLNESDIAFRNLTILQDGKAESVSDEFLASTKAKFEALHAGDLEAFK